MQSWVASAQVTSCPRARPCWLTNGCPGEGINSCQRKGAALQRINLFLGLMSHASYRTTKCWFGFTQWLVNNYLLRRSKRWYGSQMDSLIMVSPASLLGGLPYFGTHSCRLLCWQYMKSIWTPDGREGIFREKLLVYRRTCRDIATPGTNTQFYHIDCGLMLQGMTWF
jgi:hypothetical protein